MNVPLPPLRAGMTRRAGLGLTTVRPDFDFETYSEAGFVWNADRQKWESPAGAAAGKKGLPVVGAAVYAQHPSTEVLCMAYDLKDGTGRHFWHPRMPPPQPLLDFVARGGEVEGWNVAFEWWIWNEVCVRRYGWPPLAQEQTYDAMAKARAFALPGSLGNVSDVLALSRKKDPDGDRLLKKFSMPRNPTKADGRLRIVPNFDDPADEDAQRLKAYNLRDIEAEFEASWRIPDLQPLELQVWRTDQRINRRGMAIDLAAIDGAIRIIGQANEQYGRELKDLAGCYPTELQRLRGWLGAQGLHMETMDEDAIEAALADPLIPAPCRRALEIRQAVGSASVKKVFAMRNQVARGGRLHDLYTYHGAHTGRPTGNGPQPTNLPRSGPDCWECAHCGHHHNTPGAVCPWCFAPFDRSAKRREWSPEAMEDAITIATTGSLPAMEWFFGDAMHALAGTLRGLFVAPPGYDYISSDFSAIEGVVTAALANEQWRLDVFRSHGMIYEMSAAKIIGEPFEAFIEYKKVHKKHHPARQGVGKVAELACLAGDTLVLTHLGPVPLSDVTTSHLVHDGVAWVAHQGLVSRGVRSTVELAGIRATPDHRFLAAGAEWVAAADLVADPVALQGALGAARRRTPPCVWMAESLGGEPGGRTEPVFDLLEAGHRNRFVVLTDHGPLIAHNCGFGGWINAMKAFGAERYLPTDEDMKRTLLAWREASPAVVHLWGSQRNGLTGLEGGIIQALRHPGQIVPVHRLDGGLTGVSYTYADDVLYAILPSGRHLTYHRPRISSSGDSWRGDQVSYEGWNTNPKNGPPGWIRKDIYGGRATENVVQAVARDIQMNAIELLEAKGYPVVMHTYDEIVSEVPAGFGSVKELEATMATLPGWAKGWPIKADGGWRANRYRKG